MATGDKADSDERVVIDDKELAEKAGGASSRLRTTAARKSRPVLRVSLLDTFQWEVTDSIA